MLVLEYKVVAKKIQYQAIEDAIRTTQFIRNKAIRYWMDAPKEKNVNKAVLSAYSKVLRDEFKFVKDLNSMACQAATERAWSAIYRFYGNCKKKVAGKKGFPRFQKDNRSVEYKNTGWKLHPTKRRITITDKKGIGELKLLGKWDIHTYDVKLVKRVRLVRRADGYYCQFAVKVDNSQPLEPTGNQVGLDVGLEYFYSDSNGNHVENPRFLRKAEKNIKRSQRRIYKHKKGSNRRRKSRKVYAQKHLRVSRQRTEFAKRLALTLVRSSDLVAYEDLNVKNMVKNHCLAKSINDAAWYQFREWIEYFSDKYGRQYIAVAPHYTSQNCSSCGAKVKKSLSTRTHKCSCGCELQRDVNAAINILVKALGPRDDVSRKGMPSKTATGGQPESNARGVATSTLLGESLVEQVATLNRESSCL
ncbi:RNA-guided endonuclease InsQ/TnpB family protein [Mastigocoleus testarum]|uniref:Transposase n=1 Tax=Mastigocoleus testarum BC008 TaxID=371196 RepID=A0A0V7ZGL3_9CYAN|nr:RNA-guided endonuclease TnpB family protein [Mastigocoleus testarum]KST63662.1 transposase [Mastigocoleus testarum BC008]KST63796.1 transposase [Mastigocoleus testarum BC008]